MLPYFSSNQILLLLIAIVILISSVITYSIKKEKTSVILLVIASLFFGFFFSALSPYLNLWDEQYHALVAKNMMDHPLSPMLCANPILGYDYRSWISNHIWLHKQPLFLLQIAISLKLFGINELSVRIPSIIMHAIISFFIYRIGKISANTNIGFYGALFFAIAYYPLALVAGTYGTDHNDIAVLFYVAASFWAWFEYEASNKKRWLLLIGLFSGCAVLVKWLAGLLIYPVWFLARNANSKGQVLNLKSHIPISVCMLISAIVIAPWQLYILSRYPLEANYEYALNTTHFFQVVENHTGNAWFHINALKQLYGEGDLMPFLILVGLVLLSVKTTNSIYRAALISSVVFTYLFYSLAATKATAFCLIVAPVIFLGIGALIDFILRGINNKLPHERLKTIFIPTALLFICFLFFNFSGVIKHHTMQNPNDNGNRQAELLEMQIINKIKELPEDKYVIFNANMRLNGNIPVMFYTNNIAYDFLPTEEQIKFIKSRGYKIAIINLKDDLPDYLKSEKQISLFHR